VVFVLYQVLGALRSSCSAASPGPTRSAVPVVHVARQIIGILLPALVLIRLRTPGRPGYLRMKLPSPVEIVVTVVAVFSLQQVLQGYLALQEAIPLPDNVRVIVERIKELLRKHTVFW